MTLARHAALSDRMGGRPGLFTSPAPLVQSSALDFHPDCIHCSGDSQDESTLTVRDL